MTKQLTIDEATAVNGVTHGLTVSDGLDKTEGHIVVGLNCGSDIVEGLVIPIGRRRWGRVGRRRGRKLVWAVNNERNKIQDLAD